MQGIHLITKSHQSHSTGEHHEWFTGQPYLHHLPVSHLLPSDIILWLSFVFHRGLNRNEIVSPVASPFK